MPVQGASLIERESGYLAEARKCLAPHEFDGFCKGGVIRNILHAKVTGERESVTLAALYASALRGETPHADARAKNALKELLPHLIEDLPGMRFTYKEAEALTGLGARHLSCLVYLKRIDAKDALVCPKSLAAYLPKARGGYAKPTHLPAAHMTYAQAGVRLGKSYKHVAHMVNRGVLRGSGGVVETASVEARANDPRYAKER